MMEGQEASVYRSADVFALKNVHDLQGFLSHVGGMAICPLERRMFLDVLRTW